MGNNEYDRLREIVQENINLKQELLKTLDEKEKLVLLCEKLLVEKEFIEKRYKNLRNSKLGRITIWIWERRGKKVYAKRKS
ncbi:hypothetical protein [Bacillus sp. X1(2014)]|uniref:hypothetical protein n=1 Tax=Bacillus sp. X1(2014) TaxID=1565991 RepID=UPI00119F2C57|nr:hypothetical protein [Bacillus sp. X1(2014)]